MARLLSPDSLIQGFWWKKSLNGASEFRVPLVSKNKSRNSLSSISNPKIWHENLEWTTIHKCQFIQGRKYNNSRQNMWFDLIQSKEFYHTREISLEGESAYMTILLLYGITVIVDLLCLSCTCIVEWKKKIPVKILY